MPVKILYTGTIEQNFVVDNNAILIDYVPLIEVKLSNDIFILKQIEELSRQNLKVVITSQYASIFLEQNITNKPNWEIACLEGNTLQQFEKMGWLDLVKYTAPNAETLALQFDLQENYQPIYFFTNKIRMATLPNILKEKGYQVHEVYVYDTIAINKHFDKHYDGIAFLSPSAVQCFFNNNKLNSDTILFAIGQTTANAIANYTTNNVVVAKTPTPQDIFKSIQQYYYSK